MKKLLLILLLALGIIGVLSNTVIAYGENQKCYWVEDADEPDCQKDITEQGCIDNVC
ncbi:MAG: hypothetical protein ACEPO8_09625 [Rhodothermaceae bacterium]